MEKILIKDVKKAAAFLTNYFNDINWVYLIDLERLQMDDSYNCILGQLFGTYQDGIARNNLSDSLQSAFSSEGRYGDTERLKKEWKIVITNIRKVLEVNTDVPATVDKVDKADTTKVIPSIVYLVEDGSIRNPDELRIGDRVIAIYENQT